MGVRVCVRLEGGRSGPRAPRGLLFGSACGARARARACARACARVPCARARELAHACTAGHSVLVWPIGRDVNHDVADSQSRFGVARRGVHTFLQVHALLRVYTYYKCRTTLECTYRTVGKFRRPFANYSHSRRIVFTAIRILTLFANCFRTFAHYSHGHTLFAWSHSIFARSHTIRT